MRLDGKIAIRRLHEIGAPHPTAFGREQTLILNTTEVFDDRIAVNNVERMVWKRQLPRVADDPFKVTAASSLNRPVA